MKFIEDKKWYRNRIQELLDEEYREFPVIYPCIGMAHGWVILRAIRELQEKKERDKIDSIRDSLYRYIRGRGWIK